MLTFGVAGAQYSVPEKGHLLLKRPLSVDHPVGPVGLVHFQGVHLLPVDEAALQYIHFQVGLAFRIKELFNGSLISLGCPTLKFLVGRPESGAAH